MRILCAILLLLSVQGAEASHCKPEEACWPSPKEWQWLRDRVEGRLLTSVQDLQSCQTQRESSACQAFLGTLSDPFLLEDNPSATQSSGWQGAWASRSSSYVIAAEKVEDIAAGVNFAREHNLKLVIKGTGHDYLGRSSAPDSLMIWTHPMAGVTLHEDFVAQGCASIKGQPAMTALAGTRWLEAYDAVVKQGGLYVQGGGCTSVGVAGGFLQGGGFGVFSKQFGTGASNLLEAEIVTADGKILVANPCQNQDLFWALQGGGGGTFGVVTKVTLKTHPVPESVGKVSAQIRAKSDADFQNLLEAFIRFYREKLSNPHWGETVTVRPSNRLEINMLFQGLSREQVDALWNPFLSELRSQKDKFSVDYQVDVIAGRDLWNFNFLSKNLPDVVAPSQKQGGVPYWVWASTQGEASAYWYAYASRYLPLEFFAEDKVSTLAHILFQASREWHLEIQFHKGVGDGDEEARRRTQGTSIHPAASQSAALIILWNYETQTLPSVEGYEPDVALGQRNALKIQRAMEILRRELPGAGSYPNEADYFEPHWQDTFWGENYPLLLAIKRKYDPRNLFNCHHCVGSEEGGSP